MGGKRFRIGSIAVLFLVVVLCVAVFSVLTIVTAEADRRTADRYAQQITQTYECLNLGEVWLSRADAYLRGDGQLPENTTEENGVLTAEIHSGGSTLLVQVQKGGSGIEILRWDLTRHRQAEQEWTLLGNS